MTDGTPMNGTDDLVISVEDNGCGLPTDVTPAA